MCSIFRPGIGPQLFGTFALSRAVAELLAHSDWYILGHNIAYDMCVLWEWYPELRELIFAAYEDNRILDTGLAQRIVEISTGDLRGQLALDKLCARYGIQMRHKHAADEDTGEEIKLGFGKHWGTDLSGLTQLEREYCLDDVVDCHELFRRIWSKGWCTERDLGKLGRTDFCLKTISAFGLRADPAIVAKLEAAALEQIERMTAVAIEHGFVRLEKKGPVKTKLAYQRAIAEAFGIACHRGEGRNKNVLYPDDPARYEAMGLVTDTGAVSTGKMVLQESGDEILIMLAELGEWQAVKNKDLPLFKSGVFHSRFGFANTLRSTSSKPNIQNFRKKAGVRECITPVWGAFVESDYTGLENATVAQLIVNYCGRRGMAEKISRGHDFHVEVAANHIGMTYEEAFKRYKSGDKEIKHVRGIGKPMNYGGLGNMRKPATFKSYARVGYGVNMTLEEAASIMQTWFKTMHDQMAYLQHVESFKEGDYWGAPYSVPLPGTDIIRRGCNSCSAANTGFQGLGMQVSADALWYTTVAQLRGEMPGRLCAFSHDSLVSDCKPDDVQQVRWHQERHMLRSSERNVPDVKMAVETVAMDRLSKDALHEVDGAGNIVLQRVAA